jgi:hypothetical protein
MAAVVAAGLLVRLAQADRLETQVELDQQDLLDLQVVQDHLALQDQADHRVML